MLNLTNSLRDPLSNMRHGRYLRYIPMGVRPKIYPWSQQEELAVREASKTQETPTCGSVI